ncbi:MAG: M50 family metallopeptidase [Planctomycetota bacterium]
MDDAELERQIEALRAGADPQDPRLPSARTGGEVVPETGERTSDQLRRAAGRLGSFERRKLALSFLAAVVATVGLRHVPWGQYVLYPLALLGTWAHELGHGLTALLVGGRFEKLVIYSNLGGTAFSAAPGWGEPLVSAGGLLGPAFAGGLLIVLGARERLAAGVLSGLALALWLSLLLWVRNLYGAVAIGALGAVVAGCAWWTPRLVRVFLAQLVGIQLCLASLSSFDYMFTQRFERDGQLVLSDTEAIARAIPLPLPYWFYGALIAALSLAILGLAFYVAWIRPLRVDDPLDLRG